MALGTRARLFAVETRQSDSDAIRFRLLDAVLASERIADPTSANF